MKKKNYKNKKIKVAVSGVGAVIGQGIVKSLKSSSFGVEILGLDSNHSAAGFKFADKAMLCPRADSPKYIPEIIKDCNREKIDIFLPGIEQDVYALASRREILKNKTKTIFVLNSPKAIKIGQDKWQAYLFLEKNKIPTPATFLPEKIKKYQLIFPLLFKKRKTYAGKGMILVQNLDEYNFYIKNLTEPYILQKFLGSDDEEYTCGLFGKQDGSIMEDIIIMKRKLNYGSTFEAEVNDFPEVKEVVRKVAEKLRPVGPTNIQLRKYKGLPMVLEINPRFSSSNSLRTIFGFNEAEMSVKHFLFGEQDLNCQIKKGKAVRYLEDLIL